METRVGIQLLTCSLAQCPLHAQAARHALDSLLDSDITDYDWRLVVVDNASTCPVTIQMLQALEAANERVRIEWPGENLGITHGRNLGFQILHEWHQPEYVVEVHTDHFFPSRTDHRGELGWFSPLHDFMQHPGNADVAIAGPSLLTAGGQWYSPKPTIPYQRSHEQLQTFANFRREVDKWARVWRQARKVRPGLSHPAVKRWSALEQIGIHRDGMLYPYDPDMPGRQNFEDTEEAYRVHQAGLRMVIHFGSLVYHHYHMSRLEFCSCPHCGEDGIPLVGGHPPLCPSCGMPTVQLNAADYNANNLYVQTKHGPAEWVQWNGIIGTWMEKAYRK